MIGILCPCPTCLSLDRRYDPTRAAKEECLRLDDIKELLGLELLGVIPESKSILTATNIGQPVICMPDTEAGQGKVVGLTVVSKRRYLSSGLTFSLSITSTYIHTPTIIAYADTVDRFLGEQKEFRFINPKSSGILSMIFSRMSSSA